MLGVYAFTLFLGALLLFMVQPMVGRQVLPLLGGTPAVWNTCMVFFQAVLLLGYAYAHALPARLGVRRHLPVHLGVLALPLLLLPPHLTHAAPPAASEQPVLWLLGQLLVMVGGPAFAIATTAPLLQRWFATGTHAQRRDPYFLYVASNFGSLAALLAYPWLVEPHVTLATQARLWSAGYVLLVVLIALCALVPWRADRGAGEAGATSAEAPERGAARAQVAPPSRGQVLRWIALAFVPSSLMLGVTMHISTDVAPIPLFWVIPLALYLITFIIAFARPGRVVLRTAIALLPIAILALAADHIAGILVPFGLRIAVHLAAFFVAAMVCHGELAATRPDAAHLTAFYLWLSVGGVLGGAFNALVAPAIFPRIIEYPLMIAFVALLRPRAPAPRPASVPDAHAQRGATRAARRAVRREVAARATAAPRRPWLRWAWSVFAVLLGTLFVLQAFGDRPGATLALHRNFFGIIRVGYDRVHGLVKLQHGSTVHGIQSRDPARRDEPLSYFSRPGPIGEIFASWDSLHHGQPVGVVGLGAGTLTCYATPGQTMTFYEIDPAVERVARDTSLFTFVADAEARGARVNVVMGDGRRRLGESRDRYGLLVLDAFSSDAIPVHLLTHEAWRLYLDHLEPDGVLAVHFSSRYLSLESQLAALAEGAGLAYRIRDDTMISPEEFAAGYSPSRWVAMARSEAALGAPAVAPGWYQLEHVPREWTDDFASFASVIQWSAHLPSH